MYLFVLYKLSNFNKTEIPDYPLVISRLLLQCESHGKNNRFPASFTHLFDASA